MLVVCVVVVVLLNCCVLCGNLLYGVICGVCDVVYWNEVRLCCVVCVLLFGVGYV